MSTALFKQIILSVDAYNKAVSTTCVADPTDFSVFIATLFVAIIIMSVIYAIEPKTNWKVAIGICIFISLVVVINGLPPKILDTALHIYKAPRLLCKIHVNHFDKALYKTVSLGFTGTALDDAVVILVIDALRLLTIEATYQ